ncbi:DUF1592 domain-containing protein [Gimesia panareensis]|uniref:PA14 domain protein n=1 Tax=Gimesia panareensis TaxID=2527978 RepID=A0A518A7V6_9PLAN|nr:DUF1592 domain-containing protein [Gimesia panareensis]QDT27948.1 PA14 domain protein [Gimesia panareensis]QDU50816.1 PA14 domain protein [Gimesia panareensis]
MMTIPIYRRLPVAVFAFLIWGMLLTSVRAADNKPINGAQIYQKMCVSCHAKNGQGVTDKANPFHGRKTLQELTMLIDETMPEEDPELCQGKEAEQVAQFVFERFFSPEEDKGNASRIQLTHLTVRQYLYTTADLMSHFLGNARVTSKENGLRAEYFSSRRFNGKDRVEKRIDPVVDFQFGDKKPLEKIKNAEEFSMKWEGSVYVEETGDYEFILKTENGARLWVNQQEPIIDEWVSSQGRPKEHKATIRLLGGRPYTLRLHVFKYKDKSSSISLQWKPPHKAQEVIPQRNLIPQQFTGTFIASTEFPPDDSVSGYERGVAVSKSWDDATTSGAIEVMTTVIKHLDRMAGTKPGAKDRREKVRQFCHRFAELAFRRPLTKDQKTFFVDQHFDPQLETELAAKRSVLLIMKSPRFLYTDREFAKPDQFTIASRLSYGLWDSMPNRQLYDAAKAGRLKTPEQISQQAERMLDDPRAQAKLRYFFHHWLQLDEKEELAKDKALFPEFDDQVVADLRTSLDMFIDDVVWNGSSDYRQLLTADYVYMNSRLAKVYQVDLPKGESFQKVALDKDQRAGVLTHPYLMANFAYHNLSSPIHRGVFVTRRLLGRSLKPPPQATEFKDGDFHPGMTTREKVAQITKPSACMSCHSIINPLGFSLEHFDAIGRYRKQEVKKDINAAAELVSVTGDTVKFNGARDLADYIARDRHAHAAFVDQLFHQAVKQPINAYGEKIRDDLTTRFEKSGYNIQQLLVEIMKVAALHQPQS